MKVSHKSSYVERRKQDYPSVEEQMDMLWHGMNVDGVVKVEPFYSSIKRVKEKYPKSS